MLASSCSSEIEPLVHDGSVECAMPLYFELADMQGHPLTRSTSDLSVSEEIKDFWLIEFNEKGQRISAPQYYDEYDEGTPLHLLRPDKIGAEYKVVMVANTHSRTLFSNIGDACNSIADLKKWGVKQGSEMDFLSYDADGCGMYLSGEQCVDVSTTVLQCVLKRSVARLTLNVRNNTPYLRIISAQIHNIPEHFNCIDCLFANDHETYPQTSLSAFFSYPIEEFSVSNGETWSHSFFLPRNIRGTGGSESVQDKNFSPKDNATYVEVIAENLRDGQSVQQGGVMRYRFYVGTDMVNNYDVIPNFHDVLNLDFNGVGNPETDSRVEDLGIMAMEEANSYILNPLPWDDKQTIYHIPISKINKFWSSVDGQEYTYFESNLIDENTDWVAEVIWQDVPDRIIYFVDGDGNRTDEFIGRGDTGFNVCTCKGACGNALVGVYKKGTKPSTDGYLWSWHMWITDYDPECHSPWQDEVFSCKVPGGHIYRHRPVSKDDVWYSEYQDRYLMDRSLGARSIDPYDDISSLLGLFYQWGRKDPLIMNSGSSYTNRSLYDIHGNNISFNDGVLSRPMKVSTEGHTWYYVAVQNPVTYFSSDDDWAGKDIGRDYKLNPWRNPDWNMDREATKSFFDPCPPGWVVPKHNSWLVHQPPIDWPNVNNYYNSRTSGNILRFNRLIDNGFYSPVIGLYISTYRKNEYSIYNTSRSYHYSLGSSYSYQNGRIFYGNSEAVLWGCDGYCIVGSTTSGTGVYPFTNNSKINCSAYQVRCIQE